MPPMHAIYWIWVIWYASWLASLFWTTRPAARPNFRSHGPYQLVTMAGIVLLFWLPAWRPTVPLLWTLPDAALWALALGVVLAFAFCWWARIEMGRLWSGLISRTENHRVIDSGPFALVRHPIYSGIIAAAFVTALAEGTVPALAGAAAFALAFWMKARIEEAFLIGELGPAAYGAYRQRVPMLIPFGPK